MILVPEEVARTKDFEKGFPIHYSKRNDHWEPDPLDGNARHRPGHAGCQYPQQHRDHTDSLDSNYSIQIYRYHEGRQDE